MVLEIPTILDDGLPFDCKLPVVTTVDEPFVPVQPACSFPFSFASILATFSTGPSLLSLCLFIASTCQPPRSKTSPPAFFLNFFCSVVVCLRLCVLFLVFLPFVLYAIGPSTKIVIAAQVLARLLFCHGARPKIMGNIPNR